MLLWHRAVPLHYHAVTSCARRPETSSRAWISLSELFAPQWCSCALNEEKHTERGGIRSRGAGLLSTCPLDWHRMGTWTVWIKPLTNCWLSIIGKKKKRIISQTNILSACHLLNALLLSVVALSYLCTTVLLCRKWDKAEDRCAKQTICCCAKCLVITLIVFAEIDGFGIQLSV